MECASGLKSKDIAHKVYELLGYCPKEEKFRPGLLAEATMPEIRQRLVQLLTHHGLDSLAANKVSENVPFLPKVLQNTVKTRPFIV